MKAAIYGGLRSIEIREVEVPAPPPGYVLLEMKACGICGSDLHQYLGRWGQPTVAGGHEVSGVIAALGEGVSRVKVGDRVAVEGTYHCGECRYCRVGLYNLCEHWAGASGGTHSGFAEYVVAHERSCFILPSTMSFEQGALVEPLAVGYRVFHRSSATSQDNLLIIGAGTIGLACLLAARASGVRCAVVAARYDHQAEQATELGADHVLRVPEQDVVAEMRLLTDGLGADVVIEATASADGFGQAVNAARGRGRVVLTGSYTQPLQVDLQPIVLKELSITSSMCYGYSGMRKDYEWSIELIASGKVPIERLVTHRFALAEIQQAFAAATDKSSGAVKVVVES